MTLAASGMLEAGAKVQYLHTLVHGEVLCHFDSFSADMESTNPLTVENIVKGLVLYFFSENSLSKLKRVMRRGTRKPCGLKKPRSLKVGL